LLTIACSGCFERVLSDIEAQNRRVRRTKVVSKRAKASASNQSGEQVSECERVEPPLPALFSFITVEISCIKSRLGTPFSTDQPSLGQGLG